MESEEQSPEYIEYDSLTELQDTVDTAIAQAHSDNWKVNFEGINNLRRINKFRKDEVVVSVAGFIEQISIFVDSPRSSICKLSLILITELFSSFHEGLIPVASKLTNLLLTKSANEKSFIKVEANKALKKISENFHSILEIVEIFRTGCYHKSALISQNAFNCILIILEKIPEAQGVEICISLEKCKRQNIILGSKDFIKRLSQNWQGFQEYLASLDEAKRKMIEDQLAVKERRASLKDTIMAARVMNKVKSSDCLE